LIWLTAPQKLLIPKSNFMRKVLLMFLCILYFASYSNAQTSITGRVTDADSGDPLVGANMLVKGTTTGSITDFDGNYTLLVDQSDAIIVFKFIGYKQKEVELVEGQSVYDVQLEVEASDIDEVIVVGYDTRKRGAVTGAVGVVEAEAFEAKPVASFDNLLQGKTAGVMAMSSSGRPGSASTILVRGLTSWNAGNDPLYVMDGVFISAGEFSALNSSDIESVSILKDASATAMYGSRGSNGVILISTKKGKKGQTEIMYRTQFGYNALASSRYEMMNTTQLLDFEEYMSVRTPGTYNRDSLEKINTNWRDAILRDTKMQSHELSVRGGSEKTSFYISAGYYEQDGIVPRSDFKRYSARVNIDHKANDWFKFGNTIAASYEKDNDAPTADNGFKDNFYNPSWAAYWIKPYAQPYNPDGSYSSDNMKWSSPLENWALNKRYKNTVKAVGSLYAEIEPVKNLKIKSTIGGDFTDFNYYRWRNPNSNWGASWGGVTNRFFSRNFRLTNSNLISYNYQVGEHFFSLLVGQEIVSFSRETMGVQAEGFANDKFEVLDAASDVTGWEGEKQEYSVLSYFSKLNYVFKDRYHLDASFRRDGSSRFGKNNRWANFWSVGAMWNILNEPFIETGVITDLRLKASYGITGNFNIDNYKHLALYNFTLTYNNLNGSAPSSPGNPNLTWEKSSLTNIGVDIALLNKYRIGVELYSKLTTDMLFEVPYSYTTGFSDGWDNVASMSNKGIEVSIDVDIIKTSDFLWNFNTNFAYNKNEITELYGGLDEMINHKKGSLRVGEAAGTHYTVRAAGVNPANGEPLYFDKNGNVTNVYSTANEVFLTGKSFIAPWTGGVTTSLSYKGLSLSAFFTWAKDKYMGNNLRYFHENPDGISGLNYSTRMLDHWKQPGDITEIAHPSYSYHWDDRIIEDASFIRFKNITISYNLPQKWLEKTKIIKGVKIYAQGQNLLTITNYSGTDPEYYGAWEMASYPQYKAYTFGLDVKF
jgi:TonB-linked SusC/RagA family outer membrane protein